VILQHSFRNAMLPIITIGALLFGELLAGAVLTEQIFTIPGFGKLIVDAVFNRDYAVVQGVVLCTAVGFILMNLLADVLYVLLNPRMRSTLLSSPSVSLFHPPARAARSTAPGASSSPTGRPWSVAASSVSSCCWRSWRRSFPSPIRVPRIGARSGRRPLRRIGSAPTKSAGTFSRA